MKLLISHIEFLLHTHNCVIVPGLGGFVINSVNFRKEGVSTLHPSYCEMIFNRELTYNDGLLIESYMRTEKLIFDAAKKKVEHAVKELKIKLREEKHVSLGELGSFSMIDDNRFSYEASPFVRPENYGMRIASLKPIIQLQNKKIDQSKPAETKKIPLRKISVGAAVAAIVLLIMLLFPVQDTTVHHQTAQFLAENGVFTGKTNKKRSFEESYNTEKTQTINSLTDASTTKNLLKDKASSPQNHLLHSSPRFYIVTGVYQVRKAAEEMMEKLANEGFNDASFLERPGRLDVYAASFETREDADNYLIQMKNKFKHHREAWILKK